MARVLHTIAMIGGSDLLAFEDLLHLGKFTAAYNAGGSAGASVTGAIAIASIPPNAAFVVANVPVGVSAYAVPSATGLTLTITPTNSANTLAAGSIVVLVFA